MTSDLLKKGFVTDFYQDFEKKNFVEPSMVHLIIM